jgi:hypothetical protein
MGIKSEIGRKQAWFTSVLLRRMFEDGVLRRLKIA